MFDSDLAAFGKEFTTLCVPFARKATADDARIWFDGLRDLSLEEVRGGARLLLADRSRREGFPTPGDWRMTAEAWRSNRDRATKGPHTPWSQEWEIRTDAKGQVFARKRGFSRQEATA